MGYAKIHLTRRANLDRERVRSLHFTRRFSAAGLPRLSTTSKSTFAPWEMYPAGDPEILADQAAAKVWMVRYNASLAASAAERCALLRELLSGVGDGAVIRPPVHCDFGYNIRIGSNVLPSRLPLKPHCQSMRRRRFSNGRQMCHRRRQAPFGGGYCSHGAVAL